LEEAGFKRVGSEFMDAALANCSNRRSSSAACHLFLQSRQKVMSCSFH
jgi:hypothetical protein